MTAFVCSLCTSVNECRGTLIFSFMFCIGGISLSLTGVQFRAASDHVTFNGSILDDDNDHVTFCGSIDGVPGKDDFSEV